MASNDCSKIFAHELGHSLTLAHAHNDDWRFNHEGDPWAYDNIERHVRTWYRVSDEGALRYADTAGSMAGKLAGKFDPMSYEGEVAEVLDRDVPSYKGQGEEVACWPQYTTYQARKAQAWLEEMPVLMDHQSLGVGVYKWDASLRTYMPEPRGSKDPSKYNPPVAMGVPAFTVIGAIGAAGTTEGNSFTGGYVYPAVYVSAANIFSTVDPFGGGEADWTGAQYYLEVENAGGGITRALINAWDGANQPEIQEFSVNVAADTQPRTVRLYRSQSGYPSVQVGTLLHTRTISAPSTLPPPVVTFGRRHLGSSELTLSKMCDVGLNCDDDSRSAIGQWRPGQVDESVFFPQVVDEDGASLLSVAGPSVCAAAEDKSTQFAVDVTSPGGRASRLTVRASREVSLPDGTTVTVPMTDRTPWLAQANNVQRLRVWASVDDNKDLSAGMHHGMATVNVATSTGVQLPSVALKISLEVFPAAATVHFGDGGVGEYFSEEVAVADDTGVYFNTRDSGSGPTNRVWWGSSGPTKLFVNVISEPDGVPAVLTLRAVRQMVKPATCASGASLPGCSQTCGTYDIELNAGRVKTYCAHRVKIWAEAADNSQLTPGSTYTSLGTAPLVLDAKAWHAHDDVIGTLYLRIQYKKP